MITNESFIKMLEVFLSDVPAKRLKQNIVKLLLDFLKYNCREELPDFMGDLFADLIPLFDLLDAIDRELDQSSLL